MASSLQATFRKYNHVCDYARVGQFLIRTYRTAGDHINWLQPRWEYMHYHPLIQGVDLNAIGIWETLGEIVGVVHPEHGMGTAYFEIDPHFGALRAEMLEYAEAHVSALNNGMRRLRIYLNDRDGDFQRIALQMKYAKTGGADPMSRFVIPAPFPPISLRPGFRLKSLADDNDLHKVDRVLWRGFDHGAEPPADGIKDREFMQSAPTFRKDLHTVVEAPGGNFGSYCGMWYEPVHKIAYVEPVATDPDYRRLGLGSAAVLEGIRRCGAEGAEVAYVGSVKPFYLSMGFRQIYNCSLWQREWAE